MAHGDGTNVNKTTSSEFSSTIVDAYIKKRILDHGTSDYRFRAAANKDQQPAGNGTNIKFIRYNRLVLPTALTEGVAPDADALDVETVTGQCKQYGQVVEISDVLELTMWHPVVKKAMEELAEAAARKDDAIIQNVLIAGSNVEFGDTAGVPAPNRAGITVADVLTTQALRRVISNLEMGGVVGDTVSVSGGAKTKEDGLFLGIINRRCMLDLMDDDTWKVMAQRQDKSALEKGEIYKWSKCKFVTTNFSHELTLEDPSGPPVVGVAAETTGGTFTPTEDYKWSYTRTNTKRGLEELIAADVDLELTGSNNSISLTFAIDANHTYNVYVADAAGTIAEETSTSRLVLEGIVGTGDAAQEILLAPSPTTALAKPPEPGDFTVFCNYIFGSDAFSVVDLSSLKTLVSKGAQKSDPLDQIRTMGTKFFMTALILNNAFMVRIEAASAY